ncbi:hypothetical protein [Eikenella corrodens]|uniref:hypothetical protein n=1 Tax=Eikenella corrodens TaxID=539 RepID=UPI00129B70EC|nr:hypothetical protein [Eikenella corrodens]MDU1347196.1 hypothetical protein [Eikenella corrodens]
MTPEGIERERRAFESWYSRAYLPTAAHGRTFSKYQTGTYRLQHVQDAWQAWQARASQSEWISVEDRPPEKEGYYLTCAIGCAVRNCQFDGTYFSYQQYDEEEWEFVEVIWFPDYWLSIPFPPTTNPAA